MGRCDPAGRRDEALVVGGDRRVGPPAEELLGQAGKRGIHIALVGERHRGWLGVRALHEPDPCSQRDQALHVGDAAAEVRLDDDPDVPVARRPHALEDPKRPLGVRRPLHVDADEGGPRPVQDPAQVRLAQRCVEIQPELGQLEGQIVVGGRAVQLIQDGEILRGAPLRLAAGRRVLAEVVERGRKTGGVETPDGLHRLVEALPGDEAQRRPPEDRMSKGEPREPRLSREGQEDRPQHPARPIGVTGRCRASSTHRPPGRRRGQEPPCAYPPCAPGRP